MIRARVLLPWCKNPITLNNITLNHTTTLIVILPLSTSIISVYWCVQILDHTQRPQVDTQWQEEAQCCYVHGQLARFFGHKQVSPGCGFHIASVMLVIMLWLLEEAGRSAGSWVLFTLLWTMLYKALHTSTSWLGLLARIKTRQRGSLFSKGLVRNPFLKVWPMLLNSVFKTCLCFSLPFFSIFHLRWEREGWRPPRPPLHLGQHTHMITWLWTWTRSCQTLFGPPGQNQVWQETCWKVRDDYALFSCEIEIFICIVLIGCSQLCHEQRRGNKRNGK